MFGGDLPVLHHNRKLNLGKGMGDRSHNESARCSHYYKAWMCVEQRQRGGRRVHS
ncbi:hypothetical protein JCM10914_4883 [Paenibacillus sp. JCM 10914]|nr:hypothetical protein JCM10914_4883 [Paenibacillus sp. JCM 10914]